MGDLKDSLVDWESKESPVVVSKVREAQIEQLYAQTWGGLLGSLIIAGSVCFILWQVIPPWKLLGWAGSMVMLILIRGILVAAFKKRSPSGATLNWWANLHVISAAVAALLWGAPSFLLWPHHSPVHQLVWPICIVSVSASSVAMYSVWSPSFISFLLLSAVPIALRLLTGGSLVYFVLGLLGFLFIVLLVRTGGLMHAANLKALLVSIRNEMLTRVVSEEKQKVDMLNAQLYEEIAEHKRLQKELQGKNVELEGLNSQLTETTERLELSNRELSQALANVKQLSGMLPICASCKKIRNDKGYWEQIEGYFCEHSEVEFSHGICPECTQKLYPDLYKKLHPED